MALNQILKNQEFPNKDENKIADIIIQSLYKGKELEYSSLRINYEQFEKVKFELQVKGIIRVHPELSYNRILTELGYKIIESEVSCEFYNIYKSLDLIDYILFYLDKNGFFPDNKGNSEKVEKALNKAKLNGYIYYDGKHYRLDSKGMKILENGNGYKKYEESLNVSQRLLSTLAISKKENKFFKFIYDFSLQLIVGILLLAISYYYFKQ